jgi:dephospho-CoA kinase
MEGKNIILEVPLLFEAGWEHLCDQTILLVCEESVQKQRLHKRNYSSDFEQFLLKRHWSNQKKMIKADHVIDTSSYVEGTLRIFVDKLQGITEKSLKKH